MGTVSTPAASRRNVRSTVARMLAVCQERRRRGRTLLPLVIRVRPILMVHGGGTLLPDLHAVALHRLNDSDTWMDRLVPTLRGGCVSSRADHRGATCSRLAEFRNSSQHRFRAASLWRAGRLRKPHYSGPQHFGCSTPRATRSGGQP